MEKQKFKDAGEFINHLYVKYYGDIDKSSFPNSLMDNFDMIEFAKNCIYKDVYEILMNSNPINDFMSFYDVLAKNDKNNIKTFSFTYSDKIVSKYNQIFETIVEASWEADKIFTPSNVKEEGVDENELDLINYVDLQYDDENKRIIDLMESLTKKCSYVSANIESLNKKELTEAQSDILNLISQMRDKRYLEPSKLLNGAALIFRQANLNKINNESINKLTAAIS
ncbi:MAG: hypothetical protein MJZ11_10755 [Lachnospiraceae bacterium]|nr:hypothetical protein [Lachnospiraceae bacterium]